MQPGHKAGEASTGPMWVSYIVSDLLILALVLWLSTRIPRADQATFILLLVAIELESRFVFGQLCYRWLLNPFRRPLLTKDDAAAAVKSYEHRTYAIHVAMALSAFYGAGLIYLSVHHSGILPFLRSTFYTAIPGAVGYGLAVWRIPRRFNVQDYELVGFVTAWTIALVLAGGVVFTQGGGALDVAIAAAVMSCIGKPLWVRIGPSQALAARIQQHKNITLRAGERFYLGHTLWSANGQFCLVRRLDGRLVMTSRGRGQASSTILTRGTPTAWWLLIHRRGDYVVLRRGDFVRSHRTGHVIGPALDDSVYRRSQDQPDGTARYLTVSDDGELRAVDNDGVIAWKCPDDPDGGTLRAGGLSLEQAAARQRRQAAAMLAIVVALDFPLSGWVKATGQFTLFGQGPQQVYTFGFFLGALVYGIWLGYRFPWVILLVLTLGELVSAAQIDVKHEFGWPVAVMAVQTVLLLSPAVQRHTRSRRLSLRRSGRLR
jgi:hypothetical protein